MKQFLPVLIVLLLAGYTSYSQREYEVTTIAGSGNYDFADGTGASASFNTPWGIAIDASGNLLIADDNNSRIRKISPTGIVTTFAGSGIGTYRDGLGTAASFNGPSSLVLDDSGNIYLSDRINNRIRKITSSGVVTTIAGSGPGQGLTGGGYLDGIGTAASFSVPSAIAIDSSRNLYVADSYNNRIRKISPTGVVTTIAGSGARDFADGSATSASFNRPQGIAVDASGNVFVADTENQRIRKISPTGEVSTFAGSGNPVFQDGIGTAASFKDPVGLAFDAFGNLFVTDVSNNRIRKITAAGEVTTIAGSLTFSFADGIGAAACFNRPLGIALDSIGNIFIVDSRNNRIRKISALPNATKTGISSNLKIYPNPATSHFAIEVTSPTTVQVINSLGQVVISQAVNDISEISTEQLSDGIYTVLTEGFKATNLVVSK